MKVFKIKIQGSTPFLMNRFSEEAVRELKKTLQKGTQKAEVTKEEAAEKGTYRMKDGTLYIPSEHFEGALKNASKGKRLGKISIRQFVAGSVQIFPEQISLKTKKISGIDERTAVNNNVRPPARVIKYRAFVFPWQVELEIHYLETHLTEELIRDLLEEAGQRFGVGNYCPRHGGKFGMFKIVK